MRILRGALSLLLTLCASLAAEAQNLATFSGTLVRRDSSAVAMAKVKLPLLERTATTDDSGHFEIRNLPAGKHEVTVWAPGAAPVSMELVLLAGESYNMRIVLADDVQQLRPPPLDLGVHPVLMTPLPGEDERRALVVVLDLHAGVDPLLPVPAGHSN